LRTSWRACVGERSPIQVQYRSIEPVPAAHQQAVAAALRALLADVQAAELFGALEDGPDNLGVGSVLLAYEVDRAQRVITVQRYVWFGA
jgi:hypothetical protein